MARFSDTSPGVAVIKGRLSGQWNRIVYSYLDWECVFVDSGTQTWIELRGRRVPKVHCAEELFLLLTGIEISFARKHLHLHQVGAGCTLPSSVPVAGTPL